MKVVITAQGERLDAEPSPVFGRCPVFLLVDAETRQVEALRNPAVAAPGGAGVQAAQLVVDRGAQAVITGRLGPNAARVLQAAGVDTFQVGGRTAGEALDRFVAGELSPLIASAGPPVGGRGQGRGQGRGRGGRRS
jgi:predicted Fe-Mo cluster-binding NifX family protein